MECSGEGWNLILTKERIVQRIKPCLLTLQLQMDRKTLSEYLCVSRKDLYAELVRLQKNGLLEFNGNRIALRPDAKILYDAV